MGTVADKLSYLADTKERLRQALGLGTEVPFRDYAGAVGGGGADHCIEFSDTAPENTGRLWIRGQEPGCVQLTLQPLELTGEAPALSSPLGQVQAVSLGEKLWYIGGWGPYPTAEDEWLRNDEIRYFDPATGTHTVTALRLPQGLCRVAAAAVGEKIYLFGGQCIYRGMVDQILVLDTAAMTLTALDEKLPEASYRYAAAVGETVYLFGGFNGSVELDQILAFDTATRTLRVVEAVLPEPAWALGVAVCGGKVYLFGGQRGSSRELGMDRILRFDPETETLTEMGAKLPLVHMNPVAVTVGEDIWILGGYCYTVSGTEIFEYYDSVDIYHPQGDWLGPSGLRLPENRSYMAAGLVGSRLYAFGGMVTKDLYTAAGWYVETKPGLEADTLRVQLSQDGAACTLMEGKIALRAGVASLALPDAEGTLTRPQAYAWQDGEWKLI